MGKAIKLCVVCLVMFIVMGCGKKSGLEGKVVDGQGKPLAGLKVMAKMEQPIKGYEQFDTVTDSDGNFSFRKLYPGSKYVLKPWSDKWTTEASATVETGPDGETVLMPNPLVINKAYSAGGSLVIDLATGKTRFMVSGDGVIADLQTNLEWVVGPDQPTDFNSAVSWVNTCGVAGGGWRMPSLQELSALYQKGIGERNMDPAFKTTGWWVWSGEIVSSWDAWRFYFRHGYQRKYARSNSDNLRAFAVRSRR